MQYNTYTLTIEAVGGSDTLTIEAVGGSEREKTQED